MGRSCNKNLKKLADSSALRLSAVPVLVCDEDFFVCTKSIGFEQMYAEMLPKQAIDRFLPTDAAERLRSCEACAFSTDFWHNNNRTSVIAVKTDVSGESCNVIIFELLSVVGKSYEAQCIKDGCEAVAAEVHELLNSSSDCSAKLKQRTRQLSRLFTVIAAAENYTPPFIQASSDLGERLALLVEDCREVMPIVGANIHFGVKPSYVIKIGIQKNVFDILVSTLIMCAVALCSDGAVEVSDGIMAEDKGRAEVTFSFHSDHSLSASVIGADELAAAVPQFSLELAALRETASRLDVALGCRVDGDRLTVFCNIPATGTDIPVMNAPLQIHDHSLREMLADMYELLRDLD